MSAEPGFADDGRLALGRLVSIKDRGAHTRFNYDSHGRVRRASRRVAKPPLESGSYADPYEDHWYVSRTDYDLAGRVTVRSSGADVAELLVAGTSNELYNYSDRGMVRSIASSYGSIIDSTKYEPDGLPKEVVYGDHAHTKANWWYDDRRRLWRYFVTRSPQAVWQQDTQAYPKPPAETTPTELAMFELTHDRVGNPKIIRDLTPDTPFDPHNWPMSYREMHYL